MDSLYDKKKFSTPPATDQRFSKMIGSSSRPVRALMIVFVLLFIYFVQPFTGGKYTSSHTSTGSHSWPHWSKSPTNTGTLPQESSDAEPKEGGARMRQATMIYDTDKFNAVYERSVDTHIKHGDLYNIPTSILRHDVVDAGFFNKPAFLLGLVIQEMAKPYGQRADWIVWFDADTVILNPTVPWSLFTPPADFDDIHIIGTQDQNGFNAGMMLLHVHEWTVKMLSEVIALRQLRPEVEYPFYDQGATKWVCERPGYEEHLLYQPHDWWNAFGLAGEPYNTDRFMLHFAGVDCCDQPEKKTVVMGRWLDIVEHHPGKHTTPLENTTYPAQVEDYWKRLKNAKNLQAKADKWKKETDSKPENLEKALNELKHIVMRNADSADKVNDASKNVEDILGKVIGSKPAEEKKKEAPEKPKDAGKEKGKEKGKEEKKTP